MLWPPFTDITIPRGERSHLGKRFFPRGTRSFGRRPGPVRPAERGRDSFGGDGEKGVKTLKKIHICDKCSFVQKSERKNEKIKIFGLAEKKRDKNRNLSRKSGQRSRRSLCKYPLTGAGQIWYARPAF
jgi:hypothetical protein